MVSTIQVYECKRAQICGVVDIAPKDGTANMFLYGYLNSLSQDVLEAKCALNLWNFPFDTQTCNLSFILLHMFEDIKGMDIVLMNSPQAYRFVTFPNDEWELLNTFSETMNFSAKQYDRQADGYIADTPAQVLNNIGAGFSVLIVLRRYYAYYLVNIIVPVIVLSLLDFVPFAMEETEHEKIVTAVSVVLGFMFLQVSYSSGSFINMFINH